jgi:hypothetical protein
MFGKKQGGWYEIEWEDGNTSLMKKKELEIIKDADSDYVNLILNLRIPMRKKDGIFTYQLFGKMHKICPECMADDNMIKACVLDAIASDVISNDAHDISDLTEESKLIRESMIEKMHFDKLRDSEKRRIWRIWDPKPETDNEECQEKKGSNIISPHDHISGDPDNIGIVRCKICDLVMWKETREIYIPKIDNVESHQYQQIGSDKDEKHN